MFIDAGNGLRNVAPFLLVLASCVAHEEGPSADGPADNLFGVTEEEIAEIENENAAPTDVMVECDRATSCEPAFSNLPAEESQGGVEVAVQIFNFSDSHLNPAGIVSVLNEGPFGEAGAGFRFTIANEDYFDLNDIGSQGMLSAISTVADFHRRNPGTRRSDRMPMYFFTELTFSTRPIGGFAMIPGLLQELTPQTSGIYIGAGGSDDILHEVGHWFGLSHTFRGGCNPLLGDYVSDTPPHTNGPNNRYAYDAPCDGTLDTCPGGGVDPVNNLMSYADCGRELTAGQISRVRRVWRNVYAALFNQR